MSSLNSSIKTNFNNKGNKGLFTVVMIGLAIILILFFIYSTYQGYTNFTQTSPYIISGITDGTTPQTFPALSIPPPSDSQYGTEFTYSFWIFIKDTTFSASSNSSCPNSSGNNVNSLFHIFHKGSTDYIPANQAVSTGNPNPSVTYPLLQSPGVWLYPNTNKFNIRFNTYENIVESADVGNIPLNTWVNVIIILIGNSVDVYINGNLKKRVKLQGVPKLNYGNLYTSNFGGFQGYLSNLRYFNYAIQPYTIDQIFNAGPSTMMNTTNTGLTNPTVQLSPNYWMTSGYPNIAGAPSFNQNPQTTA